MSMKRTMSRLRRLCAIIVGTVFFLAGVFKLFDPVGAGLVMEEYLRFLHLPFLTGVAEPLAFALALLEALVGAALISGIMRKLTAVLTFLLLGVFTLLTLFLAIFNPEMECGCFGEVIHLTNVQTFVKNLVLLALSFAAFIPFSNLGEGKRRKIVAFMVVAVSTAVMGFYHLHKIPPVDFTAFAPGCELMASLDGSEDTEEYTASFIYEKNGQEGAFTLDRLPDSTWTYVRTETILINRLDTSDETPSLSFHDSTGLSRDALAADGNVLVISVHTPEKVKGEDWTRIADAVDGASSVGFVPILLVASTHEAMDTLDVMIPAAREKLVGCTYTADRKTLLALNRSNGGATWFSDGQLVCKYDSKNLPEQDDLLSMTGDDPTSVMLDKSTKGHLRFEGFLLYALAILLIL